MTLDTWRPWQQFARHRSRGLRLSVFLVAGALTGVACVAFMWRVPGQPAFRAGLRIHR